MDTQHVLTFVDTLIFTTKGRYLSDLQRLMLCSYLTDPRLRYDDIAKMHGYSLNYLKQDVGPKLWQMLSEVCGEKVTKTNFRSAIERKCVQSNFLPDQTTVLQTGMAGDFIPAESNTPSIANIDNSLTASNYQDWGDAPDVSIFYNRVQEIETLKTWIITDKCRLVVLSGMGGIGKTHLSIKIAEQIQSDFEYLIWRSLVPAKPLLELTLNLLRFLTQGEEGNLPNNLEDCISTLISIFKKKRCLLILDNVETILSSGVFAGQYQEGYEEYRKFFQCVGERSHNSCLLLTTREKPQEITFMQGEALPVRSLKITGLNLEAGQQILQLKGCFLDSEESFKALIENYGGNPLALKIISAIAADLYDGNISEFINNKSLIPREIHDILDQQFYRLRESEQNLLYRLTLEQHPVDEKELNINNNVRQTIQSLLHRSFLEVKNKKIFLQPVVREYLQNRIIDKIAAEIECGNIELLNRYPLVKSTAKEYLKQSQVQLMLKPLLERLIEIYGNTHLIHEKLKNILDNLRKDSTFNTGYGAGNILNFLCYMQAPISEFNFSGLTVRSACLQKMNLRNVNFANADLSESIFSKQLTIILSLAYSPDGKLLATGDVNGEIHIWKIANSEPILSCKGHAGWVHSIAFSNDGKMLGSCSSDHTIKLWDVNDGSCLKTFTGHEQRVRSIAFSPGDRLLASGGSDATIRIWDIHNGDCLKVLLGHQSYIWSVAFSPDGQTIASGSEDKSIKFWHVDSGQCWQTLTEHSLWIRTIAFSPNGKLLASGGGDRAIKIWDIATGQCLHTLTGHTQRLRSIAFSPDGKLLASGSGDHTVRLWQVINGQCLKTLHGHNSMLTSVVFSPDGINLATGGEDRSVRLWEVDTGSCIDLWQGYGSWIQSVAFSPDGRTLASGSEDKTVRLWHLSKNQSSKTTPCLMTLAGHQGWVCSVAYSPDGKYLASGSSDYSIKLWDVWTGQCLKTFKGHKRWIGSVAFSPDGLTLGSCSGDFTIKLWDVITGNCWQTLTGHSGWLWSIQFSPKGQIVASASEDTTIKIWDIQQGECLRTLIGHNSWVQGISFSPDGLLLASASCDCTVRLWEVETGKCLKILRGHTSWVQSVKFSPDGKTLASGSCDQSVKLWDIDSGECLQTIPAHSSWVWSVDFSPDGLTIASGSQDETIQLWDIHNNTCLDRLRTERPYEGMQITGARGLTTIQKESLKFLGAID